jgi:hypothetical protein
MLSILRNSHQFTSVEAKHTRKLVFQDMNVDKGGLKNVQILSVEALELSYQYRTKFLLVSFVLINVYSSLLSENS